MYSARIFGLFDSHYGTETIHIQRLAELCQARCLPSGMFLALFEFLAMIGSSKSASVRVSTPYI